MKPFRLSSLKNLRLGGKESWQPPAASWQRPFALPWPHPYSVRYASNLDDGPNHGVPLGGFGAGCIGWAPNGAFNLWHLDGGEHWFGVVPDCQFALFEDNGTTQRAMALAEAPVQRRFTPPGRSPHAELEMVSGQYGRTVDRHRGSSLSTQHRSFQRCIRR
jgi:non-lysosomal glucosylceramidase